MELQDFKHRHKEYKKNENALWANRFIWKGLYGYDYYPEISIINFAKITGIFDKATKYNTVQAFHKYLKKICEQYKQWCKIQKPHLSEDELNSLFYFCQGAIGEYFFLHYLNTVKTVLILNEKTNKYERFDFHFVHTTLQDEIDDGCDLLAICKHQKDEKNCAIQVKFWTPGSDTPFTKSIAYNVYGSAVANHYINMEENKNIVVCWLGDTKHISKFLKQTKIYKHLVFIDITVLNNTINKQGDITFWETLKEKIANIKNL